MSEEQQPEKTVQTIKLEGNRKERRRQHALIKKALTRAIKKAKRSK